MNTYSFALVIILLCLMIFETLLVLGLPFGKLAWGGEYRVLPRKLKIASTVSTVIYAAMAVVVLNFVAIFGFIEIEMVRWLLWGMVGLFAIGTFLNLISRSNAERFVMTPVALSLCLLSLALLLGW